MFCFVSFHFVLLCFTLPSGALPRTKFKLVMIEKIDHISGDKGNVVTKGILVTWECWASAEVVQNAHFPCGLPDSPWEYGWGSNWEDIAAGYDLETNRRILGISLRLLHKAETIISHSTSSVKEIWGEESWQHSRGSLSSWVLITI